MNIFRTLHRSILVLFAVVVVSIVTLVHFSVSKIVAEQSRAQQQSVSPALDLIVEELLQPLHISQTLAKSQEIKGLMESDDIDTPAVFNTLERLSDEFDMFFFIASEKNRTQYNSDRTQIALKEGEVSWYFKYKERENTAVADIGKWEDTHFYIDLKIFDENDAFLGFFGTGQSLRHFISVFEKYKSTYGYDFIFVDDENNITLSSDPALNAANSSFKTLGDLAWFQALPESTYQAGSLNNMLIRIDEKDFLIAEVNIDVFGWTLYLLTPLEARQAEISRGFIYSVVSLLVVIFALFLLIYNLLYFFKQEMHKKAQQDPLTLLPNRNKVELRYAELLDKKQSVAVVLMDIDHFKVVNDTHGHNAGDNVLRQVATMMQNELREEDVVGRWGGEEFLILLPDTNAQQAFDVAQKLRERLAAMTTSTGSMSIQVTASFGVSFTDVHRPLTDVLESADDALYEAKRDGRNLVKLKELDVI